MKLKISSKYLMFGMILLAFAIIVVSMSALMAVSEANTPKDFNFISGEIQNYSINLSVQDPLTGNVKPYTMDTREGENLLTFMTNLENENKEFSFSYSDSQYGTLITGINGYEANLDKKEFWKLYINSEPAEVGFSDYNLVGGDELLWQLDHF